MRTGRDNNTAKHDIKSTSGSKQAPDTESSNAGRMVNSNTPAQPESVPDTKNESQKSIPRQSKKRLTLKILFVLIVLLIFAIAALVAWSYTTTEDSLAVEFTDDNMIVDVGDQYLAMDCIADSSGDVVPAGDFLDTGSTGDKEMVFTVSRALFGGLLNPTREFTMHYSVVDSEPPVILWNGSGTVLQRGTEFSIDDVLAYGDNADPAPAVSVDGEVDMSTNGAYPLHITVTDASGNETKCDLSVVIADSVPVYEDTAARTDFRDFARNYSEDGRSFGIDVSTWQGDIDFAKVRDAGCDFVFIRAGYSSDGEVTVDSKFEQNYKSARDAGLRVGLYLYSYDHTAEAVKASADWIIETLGGDTLDLPVAFDWEDFGHFQSYGMSFNTLNSLYDVFANELMSAGYESMLYGSKTYLENVWTGTDIRPVWLAHYTGETDYRGMYTIWQASSTGRIDGINGDVDMDILYE